MAALFSHRCYVTGDREHLRRLGVAFEGHIFRRIRPPKDAVFEFRRQRPPEVESSVGCVTFKKCPQPRIKLDCLGRTGRKGIRKYHVDLSIHLEHYCALTLLK